MASLFDSVPLLLRTMTKGSQTKEPFRTHVEEPLRQKQSAYKPDPSEVAKDHNHNYDIDQNPATYEPNEANRPKCISIFFPGKHKKAEGEEAEENQ